MLPIEKLQERFTDDEIETIQLPHKMVNGKPVALTPAEIAEKEARDAIGNAEILKRQEQKVFENQLAALGITIEQARTEKVMGRNPVVQGVNIVAVYNAWDAKN